MSKVLIIDSETTGLIEPIEYNEVAYLQVEDINSLRVELTFEQRFKPHKPSELGALVTHGIMEEELVNCDPSGTFTFPEKVDYLVGANIDYDWSVLGKPDIKRICITALARYLVPGLDSYSQSALLYHFEGSDAKEKLVNAHSALADVENCRLVLRYLLYVAFHEVCHIGSWDSLWKLSEEARIPLTLTFGKHKGEKVSKIPFGYKSWLLRQPDVDPYLRIALER